MSDERDEERDASTRYIPPSTKIEKMKPRQTDDLDLKVPTHLRFIVENGEESTFQIPLSSYMVIGRRNSRKDTQVDIDLSPYNAQENGVSRFHAIIMMVNNRISIKDFNSTNGTQLNDYALQAMHAYRLRDGDKIKFGQLSAAIQYVYEDSE